MLFFTIGISLFFFFLTFLYFFSSCHELFFSFSPNCKLVQHNLTLQHLIVVTAVIHKIFTQYPHCQISIFFFFVLFFVPAFRTKAQYLGRICKGGNQTFMSPKDDLYLVYRTRKFPDSIFTPPPKPPLESSSSNPATENVTSGPASRGGRAFRLEVKAVPGENLIML